MRKLKIIILFLTILIFGSTLHAAPFNQWFRNDFQTDSIFLFITDVDPSDGNVSFRRNVRDPAGWSADFDMPDKVELSGPQIDPGEWFRVRFSNDGTFTLEWAELLNGSIQGKGSIYFDQGAITGVSDSFTSSVPINGSLWLLGSGLICLIGIRRKLR